MNVSNIIRECINDYINLITEVHLQEVDNISDIVNFISSTWSSPNDMWWIKIDQRKKDWIKRNKRNPNTAPKMWGSVGGSDGTGRENHVGYAIVRGKTKEEAIRSLQYAVVHLNPWAAKRLHTEKLYSNGGCEAIKMACNYFFARAYVTINSRDIDATVKRSKQDKKMGMFKTREFHHRAGQAKSGVDASGTDWSQIRKYGLVDCDVDDPQAQSWLESYFTGKGVTIHFKRPSHDGMHYFITVADSKKCDWNYINKYMEKNFHTQNRPGDPPILFKPDANAMLYSNIG